MVRLADEHRPAELLDAIVGYLVKNGVAKLSLRPLAKAVGSSPRGLLYYFGSKEALLAQAVKRLRELQRAGFAKLQEKRYENPSDACRAVWQQASAPQAETTFRLSLETYVLALRNPELFGNFLSSSSEDWLTFLSEPMIRKGASQAQARAFATVAIAGFRGFMLDYCATHDRSRIDRAVDLWIGTLDELAMRAGARKAVVKKSASPKTVLARPVSRK
ncbi:MAG TPA: TetR/AcrR family transcriptional regulator [Terriglobales bacterium]|nr:TetR/AcrR family transcriptional regulator [Terriglobales bacterium]